MTKEYDEMWEKIKEFILVGDDDWFGLCEKGCKHGRRKRCEYYGHCHDKEITRLLHLETDTCRIAVVRKDGELPENPYDKLYHSPQEKVHWVVHNKGQLDILKAGFVQEERGNEVES